MASLFSKVRIAVLSKAHSLLDKVIDLDSTEAVKQHVRDLEQACDELNDAAASARGNVKTVTREHDTLKVQAVELDTNINFIISDGDDSNDHLALPLQARFDELQKRAVAKSEELVTARQTAQSLGEAASALEAKHVAMVERISQLESLEQSTKAKEEGAEALRAAGRIVAGSDAVSVDDVAARLQRRADVADERFAKALGGFSGGVENDVVHAQAAARLAERKARLQVQATTAKVVG